MLKRIQVIEFGFYKADTIRDADKACRVIFGLHTLFWCSLSIHILQNFQKIEGLSNPGFGCLNFMDAKLCVGIRHHEKAAND